MTYTSSEAWWRSKLALTLLLVANATAGWWWADPVAALCMVPWLVKEGMEGLRGEDCEAGYGRHSSNA